MHPLASPPILSCGAAKAWEAQLLKDEAAEWAAMQRAGRAVAEAVQTDFCEIGGLPANARLLVLVGKGHNGGDAMLATKTMLERHPEATADVVFAFGDAPLRPLAQHCWRELSGIGHPARVRQVAMDGAVLATSYDLCLDGVFGMQFRLPLDEKVAELLAKVNTHPRIRLRAAVDLPSGLGEENAGTVFRADFTYATGIVKAPVVVPENGGLIGRLRYLDLGFFSAVNPPPESARRILPAGILAPLAELRPAISDKRTYGHLLVVGGSLHYPGAILMTVQAALRTGVGLLTACVPESLVPEYATRFPEAMWVGLPVTAAGGLAAAGLDVIRGKSIRATAVAIGPGLGAYPETIGLVRSIVETVDLPVLFDADALRAEVIAGATGKRIVCTPHEGEFQRIRDSVPADAVVVRKGPLTRIVAGGVSYLSPFGGPVLARGGSGDLLAGLIGGLLAQTPEDLLLAACRGAVWHGLAADSLARDKGQVAVQTTQLLDYLQPALHLARHEN